MLGITLEYFENWPYLAWAIGAATTFYLVTAFATSHLHPDKRAHLSLWLQGDYESTWSAQFCAMFDRIFGENHLRPRCILLSAIASVLAVFALWLLFDRILGLISLRADTGLSLTQALLLGAAINVIPDYVSLYETRWLLKQFERIRNPLGQLAVLILDALVTGLIIFAGIKAYLWLTGSPQISVVEMMALFSIYAIFFYSTFLTSIWAWAYCLSSWLSRLSARLRGWLDVTEAPGRTLALLGAVFVLIGSLAVKPALTMTEDGRIAFDDFLCETFPASACAHVARLTADEEQKLLYLGKACDGGITYECLRAGSDLIDLKPEEALRLLSKSCETGDGRGCVNLGVMYEQGLGVEVNEERAVSLFEKGCATNAERGCTNLGVMTQKGRGTAQNYARAISLFEEGCVRNDPMGCRRLGITFEQGIGVPQDHSRALDSYRRGCDLGGAEACTDLGLMHQNANGTPQNYATAKGLFQVGCDRGDMGGCTFLGIVYLNALGVDQDGERARDLFEKACAGQDASGCFLLGWSYEKADGDDQDIQRATQLYRQACQMKSKSACRRLETLSAE